MEGTVSRPTKYPRGIHEPSTCSLTTVSTDTIGVLSLGTSRPLLKDVGPMRTERVMSSLSERLS